MPSVKRWIDRLTLVGAAAGLLALLVAGVLVIQARSPNNSWSDLWVVTVVFFVAVFTSWLRLIRSRTRTLYRRWPMAVAWVVLAGGHVVGLGWVTARYQPHWHLGDWILIGWVELAIFAFVLELVYRWCLRPT